MDRCKFYSWIPILPGDKYKKGRQSYIAQYANANEVPEPA
jgi:hypothetical protein